jgi:hypothetical protein
LRKFGHDIQPQFILYKKYEWWGVNMDEREKIVLPEKLQIEMLQFFLKTSIPRIKREKEKTTQEKSPSEFKG